MTSYIPAPDPITPAWLTAVLRASGSLAHGEVLAVDSAPTGAFNSYTSHLQLHYSNDTAPGLPANLILKRNISEPWAIEAGAQEVAFYRLVAALPIAPPAIVPCYAAAYDHRTYANTDFLPCVGRFFALRGEKTYMKT
jgi:hypothetical protein